MSIRTSLVIGAQVALGHQSIYDLVDEKLLPLDKGAVLLGCTALTNCTNHPHGRASAEDAIGRRFDYLTSFLKPNTTILSLEDDEQHLRHYSWELCRLGGGDDCKWRDIADGKHDNEMVVPAARHIAKLSRPIVFGICNEMAAMGPTGHYVGVGNATDYLDMYTHVREVFAREGASKNVVWSWSMFSEHEKDKHGNPGSIHWDAFYPGDDKVDWVGVNAFSGIKGDGSDYKTVQELYAYFYDWVKDKDVHPFFHAFGTSEKPGQADWKAQWLTDLPKLLGPAGTFPKIRAVSLYSGQEFDLQTSAKSLTAAKSALNKHVFDGLDNTKRATLQNTVLV